MWDACCYGISGIVPLLGSAWLTFHSSYLTDNILGPWKINVANEVHVSNAIASKFDPLLVRRGNTYLALYVLLKRLSSNALQF